LAVPLAHSAATRAGARSITAYEPELSLRPLPGLSELPGRPWETTIFFGDARDAYGPGVPANWSNAPTVNVVHPQTNAVSATDGWVDARSAFASQPLLAQGIGGAITTDEKALLALDPRARTLVAVEGLLVNQRNAVVARSTHGYRWIANGNVAVRCLGRCVVAAQTDATVSTGANAMQQPARAVSFYQWSSWLAVATLSPGALDLLRYNVRYNTHWLAISNATRLAHIAVDSTFNGWVVPQRESEQRLVIVEWVAALQFFLMVCGILVVFGFGLFWIMTAVLLKRRVVVNQS
jgi:hypothetical protein